MTDLLRHLSDRTGFAFFFVQSDSLLTDDVVMGELSRVTNMQVVEAANRKKILPDTVYVVSAKKQVELTGNTIRATSLKDGQQTYMPVNRKDQPSERYI